MRLNEMFARLVENDDEHQDALDKTGFWGKAGAGCLFFSQDSKRFLVGHRSRRVEQPGTWGTWGGAIDSDEDPAAAVQREAAEETGYRGPAHIQPLYVFRQEHFRYYNFLLIVPGEFEPRLNWENQGFRWCAYGDWPKPPHFGLTGLLNDPASAALMQALAKENRNV